MNVTRDLRYAVRALARHPSFTATVVGTLALGIGMSTAVFSLLDAALLRPLPFASADRLVYVWGIFNLTRDRRGASYPEFVAWRSTNRSFDDLSVHDPTRLNLQVGEGAERVEGEMVSAGYFDLLGARPARGRTFTAEEDRVPDRDAVAVISDALWKTRFAADHGIVGRSIVLNRRPFTVVGVMPANFKGVSFDTDVWIPITMISVNSPPSTLESRANRWLGVIGRLRASVTMADAQRDVDRVAAQITAEHPATNQDRGIELVSMIDEYVGDGKALLYVIFGAVMLFLLIACANVISLQMVRAMARRREIALRVALGADRRRLLQQLLTEGLVLSGLGAVAGVLVAYWSIETLLPLLPAAMLGAHARVALDVRALGFALGLAVLCGLAFGLVPAARATRLDLTATLKAGGRAASAGLGSIRRIGVQQLLVVGEVGIALLLLLGAGLMTRSLQRLLAVDVGFDTNHLLTARVELAGERFTPPERARFAEELQRRLSELPGVQSVALGSDLPFAGITNAARLSLAGGTGDETRYFMHRVTPDFFGTLRIPLLRGRAFTANDNLETPPVAVISESMAKRFWPNADPIGQRFHLGDLTGPQVEIVGVVGNARFRDLETSLTEPRQEPDVYFPYAQRATRDVMIIVRAAGAPASLERALRRELASLDPGLPLYALRTMTDALRRETTTGRFGSIVLSVFSTVALVLAAVGIYGLLAFVTSLSQREIAIRVALGATDRRVMAHVVGQGMALVVAGLALGLLAATFATNALSTQLYGITATDPPTFVAVSLVLLAVALVATYIPARRVLRVDPQLALRSE